MDPEQTHMLLTTRKGICILSGFLLGMIILGGVIHVVPKSIGQLITWWSFIGLFWVDGKMFDEYPLRGLKGPWFVLSEQMARFLIWGFVPPEPKKTRKKKTVNVTPTE